MTSTYDAPLTGALHGTAGLGSPLVETFGKMPSRISRLAEALAKAQSEFTPVPKVKEATIKTDAGTYKYKYADLSDVLKMAIPVLSKNGIAFTQPIVRRGEKAYVITRLLCGSETYESDGLFIPENIKPQSLGSYLSYWKRYDGCSLLGIAPDEDFDGVLIEPERAPAPPPRAGRSLKNPPAIQQALDNLAQAVVQKTDTFTEREQAPKPNKATSFEFGANESVMGPIVAPNSMADIPVFVATDSDVPGIIGDKPSKEEKAEFARRLRDYKVEMALLGAYVKRVTGVADTKDISKQQWVDMFRALDGAKDTVALLELIK